MTDHDHHDSQDAAVPATRIDPHAMYDVADPTRVTPRTTPAPPVSPVGAHTGGAAANLNRLLDARDRVDDRPARRRKRRRFWTPNDRAKARTVRDAAARRAAARLRHERHLEVLETVKAWLAVLCLFGLLLLVVGMAVVAFMILSGFMTWAPTRV